MQNRLQARSGLLLVANRGAKLHVLSPFEGLQVTLLKCIAYAAPSLLLDLVTSILIWVRRDVRWLASRMQRCVPYQFVTHTSRAARKTRGLL